MLNICDLHTHYGLSHILHGVNIVARPGEVIGIFGRNGVGKTTLLKSVAGWVKPTSGTIRFQDVDLHNLPSERICRHGVSFVAEDRRIFPGLTVDENLKLGLLQARGWTARQEGEALERMYARFPRLRERSKQLGTTLSGGEQQMLAMARAIICQPRLLLIDEPSEGLAPMIVADLFALMRELRDRGTIILLVEQNLTESLSIADRFYAIERGRVVLEGDSKSDQDKAELYTEIAV
ncbi:ABC transporter ATP-binding protein [Pusillimonas sp.]|uniref:ABC transporter ATP-binding protein n=1 Tax=Pusillimonas sp. TaxID=3040095 RepID=UPI0029AA3623|nr:ABC transporter ATP-binding protein [Pusillimonas sp.]MDX3894639.1 ABC transporter ATP-binding protein [Pusillimonas sp.]